MRRFTRLVGVALAALLTMPVVKAQKCDFTPDAFPGQSADRTETVVDATVHLGESGSPQLQNMHSIDGLASTNSDVVTIFRDAVFFVGVGNADVTYTESIMRSSCDGVEQTIHYTVEKGTPTAYFRGLDGMAATELSVAYSQGSGGDAGGGASTGGGGEGGGGGAYVPSPLMR